MESGMQEGNAALIYKFCKLLNIPLYVKITNMVARWNIEDH
jgi:hypothetical protein